MKKPLILTLVAVAVVSGLAGYLLGKPTSQTPAAVATHADTAADNSRTVLYWYDPMSPGQRFDKPGKSPFMDMELVPRYAGESADDGGVTISARQQQNLGVRTAPLRCARSTIASMAMAQWRLMSAACR